MAGINLDLSGLECVAILQIVMTTMNRILLAVLLISVSACSKATENTTATPPANSTPPPAPAVAAPAVAPAPTPIPAPVSAGPQALVDFQASTFHSGDATWKDRIHGVVATAVGSPVGNGSSIATDNGSFYFNTDDAKLGGLKSYTIAVGFTAKSISVGGPNFYGGNGIVGADIPGEGQGDSGISLTTDGSGQIIGGLGIANTADSNLYSHSVSDGAPGYYTPDSPNGVVHVIDGSKGPGNGVVSLYVNGHLSPLDQFGQITGLTLIPCGSNNGTIGNFQYGIGAIANGAGSIGSGGTLKGSISQVQIYGTALSDQDATALSLSISKPSGSN